METDQIYTYKQAEIYKNGSDMKYWSFTPKLGESLSQERFHADNLRKLASLSFFGVGDGPMIARERMEEATTAPRESSEGFDYEDRFSFVKTLPRSGPVTVLTFLPVSALQKRSCLIESFAGDDLEPSIHQLDLRYPLDTLTQTVQSVDAVRIVHFLEELHPTS